MGPLLLSSALLSELVEILSRLCTHVHATVHAGKPDCAYSGVNCYLSSISAQKSLLSAGLSYFPSNDSPEATQRQPSPPHHAAIEPNRLGEQIWKWRQQPSFVEVTCTQCVYVLRWSRRAWNDPKAPETPQAPRAEDGDNGITHTALCPVHNVATWPVPSLLTKHPPAQSVWPLTSSRYCISIVGSFLGLSGVPGSPSITVRPSLPWVSSEGVLGTYLPIFSCCCFVFFPERPY